MLRSKYSIPLGLSLLGFFAAPSQAQCQLTKLPSASANGLGASVDIDDKWTVSGAPNDSQAADNAGAVFVYDFTTQPATEDAKLVPGDLAAEDLFGSAVAIDAETIVIGAPRQDSAGTDAGAAYVYERQGTSWVNTAKLVASDASAESRFGNSVAISNGTIVVGASWTKNKSGAVYVFEQVGGVWSEVQILGQSFAKNGDEFGRSVAITKQYSHAHFIIAGSPGQDQFGTDAGAAYVFEGPNWTLDEFLIGSGSAAGRRFGWAVDARETRVMVMNHPPAPIPSTAHIIHKNQFDFWNDIAQLTPPTSGGETFLGEACVLDSESFGVAPDRAIVTGSSTHVWEHLSGTFNTWIYRKEVKTIAGNTLVATDLAANNESTTNAMELAIGSLDDSRIFTVEAPGCITLDKFTDFISITGSGLHILTLQAGADHADEIYFLLGSMSGTHPGIPLPNGQSLPLVQDFYTLRTLRFPNKPPFTNNLGVLDQNGGATVTFTLPPQFGFEIAGTFLWHAFVTFHPVDGTIELVSNSSSAVIG